MFSRFAECPKWHGQCGFLRDVQTIYMRCVQNVLNGVDNVGFCVMFSLWTVVVWNAPNGMGNVGFCAMFKLCTVGVRNIKNGVDFCVIVQTMFSRCAECPKWHGQCGFLRDVQMLYHKCA